MNRFIAFLLVGMMLISGALAANDVASTQSGSTAATEITSSTYVDIASNNVSISTSAGELYVYVFTDSRTNYSKKFGSVRIKIDGVEVEAMNLSAFTSYTPDSFMAYKTVTEGTHYAEIEVKAYSGRKLYLRSWNMTVQFLKTGSYVTGFSNETVNPYSVNASNLTSIINYSVVPALPQSNVTNLVTDLNSLQSNDTVHDSDIGAIQVNETSYVSNVTVQAYSMDAGNLTDEINYSVIPNLPQANVTNLVTDLNSLQSNDTVHDSDIGAIQVNETSYVSNVTVQAYSMDAGNLTDEINYSVIPNLPQANVTNLVSDLSGKEATISEGSSYQFYSWDKTWRNITTSWVTEGTNLFYTAERAISALTGTNAAQNSSISALQVNDTYFNGTVYPNSTNFYNSNYNTHLSSDGSDHSYVDQDVTDGASPIFNSTNMYGINSSDVSVLFANAEVEVSPIDADIFTTIIPAESNLLHRITWLTIRNSLETLYNNSYVRIDTYSGDFPNSTVASYVNQNVSNGSSPYFDGTNITGIEAGSVDSVHTHVRKDSVGTIPKGTGLHVTGFNVGGWVEVEAANSSSASTMPSIGIAEGDITNSATGKAISAGYVTGMDTSSWGVGDALYISNTSGLTNVMPIGTDLIQKVGIVLRSHGSQGYIQVIGAGRTNAVPNIPNGYFWKGNSTGYATETQFAHALDSSDHTGTIGCVNLTMSQIGVSEDLCHFLSDVTSVGLIEGGTISNTSTTINIAAGEGLIRSTNSATGALYYINWSASGIVIPENTTQYYYVKYNGGSPVIANSSTKPTDIQTNIILGDANNRAGIVVAFNSSVQIGDQIRHLNTYLSGLLGIRVESGEVVTTSGLTLQITSGNDYNGYLNNVVTPAINTSNSDIFVGLYRDGDSNYTRQFSQTSWNNSYYDDGTGTLKEMNASNYSNMWVIRNVGDGVAIMYGREEYPNQTAAEAASQPSDFPVEYDNHGIYIAQITFLKGASTSISITSLKPTIGGTTRASSGITVHNDLSGIQGGAAADYQHLTTTKLNLIPSAGEISSLQVNDTAINSTKANKTHDGVKIKPFVFVIGTSAGLQNMVFKAPYDLTIERVDTYVHGTGSGNITYQLWKNTTSGYIAGNPLAADSIFTGNVSSGRYAVNTSISQTMVANDTLMINVSTATATGATIELEIHV